MSQNLMLDPSKRDYVVPNGSPVATDRLYEKAYFALMIPRLRWMYGFGDASLGSDLHLFRNSKKVPESEQLYAQRATRAIEAQLVANGEVAAVNVTNIASSRSGMSNNIALQPNKQSLSTRVAFDPV